MAVQAIKARTCAACGAQLLAIGTASKITCPYCGNDETTPQQLGDDFNPSLIIPFSIGKDQALEIYNEFIAEKEFLDDRFAQDSTIVSAQGIYVPLWLKDGVVDFDFSFVVDTGRRDDDEYAERRLTGSYTYKQVPADASARMPDDIMDSLNPYDFSTLQPYDGDYLKGFIAEPFTVGSKEVNSRIEPRVKNTALRTCKEECYDEVWKRAMPDSKRSCATVHHTSSKQALLPVWLFVVAFEGKNHLVGINGQTGKAVANLPISESKQNDHLKRTVTKNLLISLPFVALFSYLLWAYLSAYNYYLESLDSYGVMIVVFLVAMIVLSLLFMPVTAYREKSRRLIRTCTT